MKWNGGGDGKAASGLRPAVPCHGLVGLKRSQEYSACHLEEPFSEGMPELQPGD